MFSVSPEIYKVITQASRYLFAFFALMLLLFSLVWLYDERRKRRERFRSLPEAGNVGEMVVISGSDQLPADTWFPVPREGVLGSLRSCDLVVPCPGVHARHLCFSWQDGMGLVIRPFSGCETFVDGVSLITAEKSEMPVMIHGSCLQVGSAVLRLQLLSALEHTNRQFTPAAPYIPCPQESMPAFTEPAVPQYMPQPAVPERSPVPVQPGYMPVPDQQTDAAVPAGIPVPEEQLPAPEEQSPVQQPVSTRRKRADRWKEDFSE